MANNTTRNIYELLLAANNLAVNGVLYGGDQTLQKEAINVFDAFTWHPDGQIVTAVIVQITCDKGRSKPVRSFSSAYNSWVALGPILVAC